VEKPDRTQLKGLILAFLGGGFSSIAPAVVKVGVNADVDPIPLLTYRFLLSLLIFWILFPLFFPQSLKISWRGLRSCAWVALANTISLYAFYLAVARIDASLVLMIFSFYPLAALVFLSSRGERIKAVDAIVLLSGLLGVYLLLDASGPIDLLGILMAMIIPVFYALHLVLIQWRLSDTPAQTVALYTVTLMGVFITFFALFLGQISVQLNLTGWTVIVLTASVSTVLARLATFAGIHLVGSGLVALLGPLEILLGIMWAFLLLGERLSLVQWLGGAMILLSATLIMATRGRSKG
jgi:drug/metabolite transporter (DMT)-like permease